MAWNKIGHGHVMPIVGTRVFCTVKYMGKLYVVLSKYMGKFGEDYIFLVTEDWFNNAICQCPTNEIVKYLAWTSIPKPYEESWP